MPTPRAPSEIVGGTGEDVLDGRARVVNQAGEDVTRQFLEGATRVLELAREREAGEVLFKDGSPSCGVTRIRDGSFSGRVRRGEGVTAAALRRAGVRVVTAG